MALKYLLAGMAQSGAVLQQTLLNREIIRQLLSAEATCISPAFKLVFELPTCSFKALHNSRN
jgi:hypothetical protein